MAENAVDKARREPAQWWPEFFSRWFDSPFPTLREEKMKVEEFVDGQELVVQADMPCADIDRDIAVHVHNHALEIRGEFDDGRFFRRIALPPDATERDVHATYKDGLLEVRIPLNQKPFDSTRIEVTRR